MSFKFEDLIPASVKDKFLEDDKPAPAITTPPTRVVMSPAPVTPVYPNAAVISSSQLTPVTTNPLLDDLRARTSFESTPLGKQLQDLLDALSDSGMSEDQKIKTAMKIGHITPESVVDTLNGVMQLLAADKQKFDGQMQAATTSEVDGRQQSIAQLDSHVADLESQLNAARQQKSTLEADLNVKAAKITSLKSDYAVAFERRNSEVSQMITRYQQISLQGKS